MSRKRTAMHRLQELVRLHRLKAGHREVARLLKMGPNTERKYRLALEDAALLHGRADDLPGLEELKAAILERLPPGTTPQQVSSAEPWLEDIRKMVEKGARPKAIFDKLRLEHEGFAASLWAVRRLCRRIKKALPVRPADVSIPVEVDPGDEAQVDFGYVGKLYDPELGMPRKAWVFVMTLSHSRHMFCRIAFDQRIETWLSLHVEAFEFFGSVPKVLVPDNLKAAVIRAAFGITENPALNRSYRALARHYGFKIDPTPPNSPNKKGRVESGVKYVKRNFIKPRDFADIDDANRRLDRWVMQIAGRRIHGTTGREPLEVFLQEELPAMLPLPPRPYEMVIWKQATVHADGQVVFERRPYPVPWRLIGQQVWIEATPQTVAVYLNDERRATHARGKPVPKEVRDSFLPPERTPYRYRSRSHWEQMADRLGEQVGQYIREVFDSGDVLSLLRQVQAIVTHLEQFPPERAAAACRRASFFGNYSYIGIRNILRKGLDMEPLPVPVLPNCQPVTRPRYARTIQELLHFPMEVTDEPN